MKVCPKGFLNGPCGGFINGKCETNNNKYCFWIKIFKKLKDNNMLTTFISKYVEPKNNLKQED
ncbi:MAG: methylenetetrahydrofolate reductase C-terminal domain-containing protein [Endomicrobium sp.]|jgi:hypothetical protein|nr:methylenetetrahydrofolate reductase C-terminal domain-containing protein [Endomicrobium sp.]